MPDYAATGTFNRFSNQFQGQDVDPERHSDAAKSGRQLNAYYDAEGYANRHDGRSVKAENSMKKLSAKEYKVVKQKAKEKKEKKLRAFYGSDKK